jgi:hypothetical protein
VAYRWVYSGGASEDFDDQQEAEDWLSAEFAELASNGVDEVTLMNDDGVVYGPMSLHPPQ